jgi:hypothetical protein
VSAQDARSDPFGAEREDAGDDPRVVVRRYVASLATEHSGRAARPSVFVLGSGAVWRFVRGWSQIA